MSTYKQIEFWDYRVYPIYSRANRFTRTWIDHAIPKVKTNKMSNFPVSDITFSIHDKKETNPSRFAIGVFNPVIDDYELFNDVAGVLTKRRLFVEPNSEIFLLGIGEDLKQNEDKFYIYRRNPWNKKIYIVAYTFKHGNLIERKMYKPIKRGYEGVGSRGTRKQINYEAKPEVALKLIDRLKLLPSTKTLAMKVLKSGLFSLDTISYSDKRGTALYFD